MTQIYLFPGQGSQVVGMGADCFDAYPDLTAQADAVLGYSIRELCLDGPESRLGQTQFTQPALYTVNALSYLQHRDQGGAAPACTAGHSLGEYNALFAAGAFDFVTGLSLVQRRGELMAAARDGAMAAVLGPTVEEIRGILDDNGLDSIDIANLNAPTQTVITGPAADIDRAQPIFEGAGARLYKRLNVSGAFHSRYMQSAAEQFAESVAAADFQELSCEVIANCSAQPYSPTTIGDNLVRQIHSSVRWVDSMQLLLAKPEPDFLELGPGKVLAGLLRQIRRG